MGQKINPISNRIGIIRGWDSNWYGGNRYASKLVEDARIRKYLNERLAKASLSRITIERTLKLVTVTINTARPGVIIGKGGSEVDKLKEELKKVTGQDIQININEVKHPELDAVIVANNIARQVEGRISYRRAIKTTMASTMRLGAEGIKVQMSGRLGGAEIARSETIKEGRIPLHTFRARIDYALAEALTKVGLLGVKVWICNGEVYGKVDLTPNTSAGPNFTPSAGGHGDRDRRGGGRRDDRRGGGGGRDDRGGRGGDRRGGGGGGDRRGGSSSGGSRGGDRRGGGGGR
jgi:small subunit ribosomal protein S3